MMGLHIFVRDLLTGTWVLQDPMRWADAYPGRIATAVAAFLDTGGGTLQLTGTPEAGRVTVINTAGMAVADVGWTSMTDTELAAAHHARRFNALLVTAIFDLAVLLRYAVANQSRCGGEWPLITGMAVAGSTGVSSQGSEAGSFADGRDRHGASKRYLHSVHQVSSAVIVDSLTQEHLAWPASG
jgi:hypothetical protein